MLTISLDEFSLRPTCLSRFWLQINILWYILNLRNGKMGSRQAEVWICLFYVPSRLFHKILGGQWGCMSLAFFFFFLAVSVTKNAWSLHTYWDSPLSLHIDLICAPIRCRDPGESQFSVGGILYWDAFLQQSLSRHNPWGCSRYDLGQHTNTCLTLIHTCLSAFWIQLCCVLDVS